MSVRVSEMSNMRQTEGFRCDFSLNSHLSACAPYLNLSLKLRAQLPHRIETGFLFLTALIAKGLCVSWVSTAERY